MKKSILGAIAALAIGASTGDAATLGYSFDPGPMVLFKTDGSDPGPTRDAGPSFGIEFREGFVRGEKIVAPGFSLRDLTLNICNFDSCLSDRSQGSSISAVRKGTEIYRSEIADNFIDFLDDRWVIGNFGTVYTNVSLTFDINGFVSDWSWFIDYDGSADISNNGVSFFESFNSTGDYTYRSVEPGTWTRSGGSGIFLAPIPLPASLPMLALGLISVGCLIRRRG